LDDYIYNIGVLMVNIEFMWRGLETGKDELQFSLVQLNSEVFKIVSYDKPYTQFAGHYTIQSLETGRVQT